MIVGILGLGLIGGSFARAYAIEGHTVYAHNRSQDTLAFAQLAGAVDSPLTAENIGECDLIILSIYPEGSVRWLEENAHLISKNTLVIDACGVKRMVCQRCFPLAEEYGFTFVGGHPMAGTQFAGYKNAFATMFVGAPMVLVPPEGHGMDLLDRCKDLLAPAGFGKLSVTTAEEHDRMIAFTSQMCHVVSSAYIKSPTSRNHSGFSAGSYKDLTRVARLNPDMWAELMLENQDFMLQEMDVLLGSLQAYREAIAENDFDGLRQLLDEGRRIKAEVDGQ